MQLTEAAALRMSLKQNVVLEEIYASVREAQGATLGHGLRHCWLSTKGILVQGVQDTSLRWSKLSEVAPFQKMTVRFCEGSSSSLQYMPSMCTLNFGENFGEKEAVEEMQHMSSIGIIPLGPSWRLLVGLQGENFSLPSQRDARTHSAIQISRIFTLALRRSIYFEEINTTTSLSPGTSCLYQGQEVQAEQSCRQVGSCCVPQRQCTTEHLRSCPSDTCERNS